MHLSSVLRLVIAAALTAKVQIMSANPLRLVVTTAEGTFPVTAIRAGRIMYNTGADDLLDETGAIAHLDGDPATGPDAFCWLPWYQLIQPAFVESVPSNRRYYLGIIRVTHRVSPEPVPPGIPFFNQWPDAPEEPGLLVYAWVVNGAVVQSYAEIVTPRRDHVLDMQHVFKLNRAETQGRGTVLFWSHGKFIPAQLDARERVATAMRAMMLADYRPLNATAGPKAKHALSTKDRILLRALALDAGLVPALAPLGLNQDAGATVKLDRNAFMLPAMHGRKEVLQKLVKETKLSPEYRATCSAIALLYGHEDAALTLLPRGEKISQKVLDDYLKLSFYMGRLSLTRELVEQGARIDYRSRYAADILVDMAAAGRNSQLAWLLQQKVDPNLVFGRETALIAAVRRHNHSMVEQLLAGGADIDRSNNEGLSPLIVACAEDDGMMAERLVALGAAVNSRTKSGATALEYATRWNDTNLVLLLLNRDADFDHAGTSGETPLEIALQSGFADMARLLARRGATIELKSPRAGRSLESAIVMDVPDLIESALKAGWRAENAFNGWAPLHIAAVCESNDCIKLLRTANAAPIGVAPQVVSRDLLDDKPKIEAAVKPNDPREPGTRLPGNIVKLEFIVDKAGAPCFPRLLKCDDPRLARAALKAVRLWRFRPGRHNGHPVNTRVALPIEFLPNHSEIVDVLRVDAVPSVITFVNTKPPTEKQSDLLFGTGMEMVIDATGRVERITFRHPSIAPKLALQMRREVERYAFSPGLLEGRPVRTRMDMPAVFFDN